MHRLMQFSRALTLSLAMLGYPCPSRLGRSRSGSRARLDNARVSAHVSQLQESDPARVTHVTSLVMSDPISGRAVDCNVRSTHRTRIRRQAQSVKRFTEHSFSTPRASVASFLARQHHALFTTCLLYTSPSPRDRQKSRMPSSA